ncbi:hypothetical protein J6G99_07815 [bacterium]|nr:hypothetical protein [bacterium]
MKVQIKFGNEIKEFDDKNTIIVGNTPECDLIVENIPSTIKITYSSKYENYVIINSDNDKNILLNNKTFSKALAPEHFTINIKGIEDALLFVVSVENETNTSNIKVKRKTMKETQDIFTGTVEKNRIAIVKEIGYKTQALKNTISSLGKTSFVLNIATLILSVVCSFGMTNFLLGLKVDTSTSVLNLTTNVGFLVCISAIVLAMAFILKQSIYNILDFDSNKRYGETNGIQKALMYISSGFMFVVYAINLLYYKDIPGLKGASFFISLLFVGALATIAIASGHIKFQLKNCNYQLTNCEYREDFESVLKSYRKLISQYINSLSQNKIAYIKGSLVNSQMKMIMEMFIGLITAPFLAYGVSNTLASCFPEAANWVRISGLRFSPIFLVLATFLIIFAFLSFVRAFTIGKQIKGSEIIKFDGFHDYQSHGVTILGLDSMKSLNKEKNIVMFIACFIIFIEFTMNVSYFITEIGADIQGMFLSFVTALVPTALLIAETHLLSSTMHQINNYKELIANLD